MLEFFGLALAGLWIVVLLQGIVLVRWLRPSSHPNRSREEMDPKGSPDLERQPLARADLGKLVTLSGHDVRQMDERESVLVFLTPDCITCRDVASGLDALRSAVAGLVYAVIRANDSQADEFASEFNMPRESTIADEEGYFARAFGVRVSPTVVVLRQGRPITARAFSSVDQAVALLSQ